MRTAVAETTWSTESSPPADGGAADRADHRRRSALRRRARVRGARARCTRVASRRGGARSAARSASPTGRSGRATASTGRCGRMCGTAPSCTRRTASRRSTSPACTNRASSPRSCSASRAPLPADGDARAVLDAVEWVAAGFEIVHSVFPGWKFRAPDCTAAFGLHGRLVVGPPTPLDPDERDALCRDAADASRSTLRRNGTIVDTGVGANVLDGPAQRARASARRARLAAGVSPPLAAGEIVTTGTLTDAWPVARGETWTSDYGGCRCAGSRSRSAEPMGDRARLLVSRDRRRRGRDPSRRKRRHDPARERGATRSSRAWPAPSVEDRQLEMARATGNYRRGNERAASAHAQPVARTGSDSTFAESTLGTPSASATTT